MHTRTPLVGFSDGRTNFVGFSAASLLALFGITVAGCDEAPSAPVQTAAVADTPEAHLESVMRRLEAALDRAKADPKYGVVSERHCTYKLIPPAADGSDYTAAVTISHIIKISADVAADIAKDKPAAGDKAGGNKGPQIRPVSDDDPTKKETTETKDYKLTYKNGRWVLTDFPQDISETERTCFNIALSDG